MSTMSIVAISTRGQVDIVTNEISKLTRKRIRKRKEVDRGEDCKQTYLEVQKFDFRTRKNACNEATTFRNISLRVIGRKRNEGTAIYHGPKWYQTLANLKDSERSKNTAHIRQLKTIWRVQRS